MIVLAFLFEQLCLHPLFHPIEEGHHMLLPSDRPRTGVGFADCGDTGAGCPFAPLPIKSAAGLAASTAAAFAAAGILSTEFGADDAP
jgi:hypothetical protein